MAAYLYILQQDIGRLQVAVNQTFTVQGPHSHRNSMSDGTLPFTQHWQLTCRSILGLEATATTKQVHPTRATKLRKPKAPGLRLTFRRSGTSATEGARAGAVMGMPVGEQEPKSVRQQHNDRTLEVIITFVLIQVAKSVLCSAMTITSCLRLVHVLKFGSNGRQQCPYT